MAIAVWRVCISRDHREELSRRGGPDFHDLASIFQVAQEWRERFDDRFFQCVDINAHTLKVALVFFSQKKHRMIIEPTLGRRSHQIQRGDGSGLVLKSSMLSFSPSQPHDKHDGQQTHEDPGNQAASERIHGRSKQKIFWEVRTKRRPETMAGVAMIPSSKSI